MRIVLILALIPALLYVFHCHSRDFEDIAGHCATIQPIDSTEYYVRQTQLTNKLKELGGSAYIAEPGASTQYFGGFSNSDWRLSERPLLLIISPGVDGHPRVSILTPKFETGRARLLTIQSNSTVEFVEWPEEGNPYRIALSTLSEQEGTIYVDGGIRKFIADGLLDASQNLKIVSAPPDITELRERKSRAEIDILKCANEATVLAIRAVHKKMHIGISESEVRSLMSRALSTAGLKDGGCDALFGESAAFPHGSGGNRVLGEADFALLDCTASLHGYYSDVTRTMALLSSRIADEHLSIWYTVREAQSIAHDAAGAGVITGAVDDAARSFLKSQGYGAFFTHRLGHGIGLEVHEDPYLRGGSNIEIKTGHTFSDEPGIYIEGRLGVRLEDCFYITSEGNAVYLTEGVGGPSRSPTAP